MAGEAERQPLGAERERLDAEHLRNCWTITMSEVLGGGYKGK